MSTDKPRVEPTAYLLIGHDVCPFVTVERERAMTGRDFERAEDFICGSQGAYELIDHLGQRCVVCAEHAAWVRQDPFMTRRPYRIESVRR